MKRMLAMLCLCCVAAACNGSDVSNQTASGGPGDGKGTVVKLGGPSSKTPASWKEETPSNQMRTYQFRLFKIDGDAEDAELVVFFFGGEGGSVEENITRWKSVFAAPEGKTIDDVSKVSKFKVGTANVTYLDVAGTFLSKNPPVDPKAKTVKKTDFRRFGVIFETPNGPYFITLTGPARTVEQHKKGFDEWLKNFK